MSESDCVIRAIDHVSSEQFLAERGDEFVANAIWCKEVSCSGLLAYTNGGIVGRGYCLKQKREYSDANVHTFDDPVERTVPEEQEGSELARLPEQATPRTNIHQVARLAAQEAAQPGTGLSFRDLSDELIGGVSTGIYNDPQIGRRV